MQKKVWLTILCASTVLACSLSLVTLPSASASSPSWWNSSYARRSAITVMANDALASGYSMALYFNHSAAVSGGNSLASGNDVRVARWNGSSWTELDRILDPTSAWNSTTTKLWFKTQTAISASTQDSSYYLYYGYASAGAPPADGNNIFDVYDDFSSGSINASKWNTQAPSGFTVSQTGGQLKISGTTNAASYYDNGGITSVSTFGGNTATEVTMSIASQSATSTLNWKGETGFDGDTFSPKGNGTNRRLQYWNGSSWSDISASTLTGQTFSNRRVYQSLDAAAVGKHWEDGSLQATRTSLNTSSRARNFRYGPDMGSAQSFDIRFDDIFIRKFVTNEPTAVLDTSGDVAQLTQQGYIFENDDQSTTTTADGNTVQAAGNTAITGVKKGERLTLRDQILNSGGTSMTANMALFYDRNDGYWSKVGKAKPAVTAAGSCTDNNFTCTTVDANLTGVPKHSSTTVDSTGKPWVSYFDSGTAKSLKVASYVGSGGSGCGASGSTAWNCSTVVAAGGTIAGSATSNIGQYTSIAADRTGGIWISFWDTTNNRVMVATTPAISGAPSCTDTLWSCTVVKTSNPMDTGSADATSIAIDSNNKPAVAYHWYNSGDRTQDRLEYVRWIGSGGTCGSVYWTDRDNTGGCASNIWSGGVGAEPQLAFDHLGTPWIVSQRATSPYLITYLHYTGSGGCTNSAWACGNIDGTNSGAWPSIAFSPANVPTVSYQDTTNSRMKVASYVANGGNCTNAAAWNCTIIDTVGTHSSIGFDPSGTAWFAYFNSTNGRLKLARNVTGSGCSTGTWACTEILNVASKNWGSYPSLAFGPDGNAWISSMNTTDSQLGVANLSRRGEITLTPALAGSTAATSIATSHADMSSASDSANKTDADCTSGTWVNGIWSQSEEIAGYSLAMAKCTELAWTIDTAQAQASTTYRFVVASKNVNDSSAARWRGPASISQYPTLSTEAATTARYAKDASPDFANCNGDTSWGCLNVAGDNTAPTYLADSSSIAFDATGKPSIAYGNTADSSLNFATYTGTGGSGCATGITSWSCITLDKNTGHTFATDKAISLQYGPDGTAWVTYYDSNATYLDMRVAKYVGSGGSGCATGVTTWTCESIFTTGDVGQHSSLVIDASGRPYVSIYDKTGGAQRLIVASYTTNGSGSGCASANWTCTVLLNTLDAGGDNSIALDATGAPWISYHSAVDTRLGVARYVGSGGAGCLTSAWTCYAVDTSSNAGLYTAIAFNGSGTAYVFNYEGTSHVLRVATFVGTGGGSGSGCGSGSSTAWSCQVVDNLSADEGAFANAATDSAGNVWATYKDTTNTAQRVARYVGSGGTGCGTSTVFTCTSISSTSYGSRGGIAFDRDGTAWVSQYKTNTKQLFVAKQHRPTTPLSGAALSSAISNGHNANMADARYRFDSGYSPRTTCAATSNRMGYCALSDATSNYDSIATVANEQPLFTFAQRSASNAAFPDYNWTGQSNVSASTANILLQVYRYGSVNAWTTLDTNSTASTNTDFLLSGTASAGSASEYWLTDGSNYWVNYRVYQASTSSAPTLKTNFFGPNSAPNPPASLAQYKSNGSTAITLWTDETSVVLKANVSDVDNPDTDALCVEVQPISTSFTNVDTACGSTVSYIGSALSASVTITGLSTETQYHWQARTLDHGGRYSTWTSFGVNAETNIDFGVDLTNPAVGSVFDGSTAGLDITFNAGSTTAISANWSGFTDTNGSGIATYQYSVGTTAGAVDILAWTDLGAPTTAANPTSLALHTSQKYFFNVRAVDAVGHTSSVASSNGQFVAPTLTFNVTPSSVTFANLNASNSRTDIETASLSVTTNAYAGYQVRQYASQLPTSGSSTIPAYSSAWSSPTTWTGYGFGYTSSDTSVAGSNRFATRTAYASVPLTGPGDIIADSATAAVSGNSYSIDYKIAVPSTQVAGVYRNVLILSCTASF